ncbi:hypothetical protein AB2N08_22830, partial [Massilia aurea]|uniref:hypothetical protein n=1 Tax=Massilia aurea TaxID=373040 RepID=UPI003461925A
NRTVKRLCADDSAATSVKVGYRQASNIEKPRSEILSGAFRRWAIDHARSAVLLVPMHRYRCQTKPIQ